MKHRLFRVLAAVMACGLVAVLWATEGAASSAAATKFAGTLNICYVEDYSSFLAEGNLEFKKGDIAWQNYVNAHGGVVSQGKHYKINSYYLDDGSNAAQDLTEVQQCVQSDHPLAIVMSTGADAQSAQYLKTQKIAVLGNSSYNTENYGVLHNFFPLGITQPEFPWAAAYGLKQSGQKKVAVVSCVESPACFTGVPIFAKYASALGMTNVYTGTAASASASFTSTCLAAQQAGATGIYLAATEPVSIRFIDNCAQQGYHPRFISGGGDLDQSAWSDSNLNGLLMIVAQYGWEYEPQIKAIQTAMNEGIKLIPNADYTDRGAIVNAWFFGGVIQTALSKIKGPVNAANFLTGMTEFKKVNPAGLSVAPLTFKASGPQPILACGVLDVMKNGKPIGYSKVGKPVCVPNKEIAVGGITATAGSQQP